MAFDIGRFIGRAAMAYFRLAHRIDEQLNHISKIRPSITERLASKMNTEICCADMESNTMSAMSGIEHTATITPLQGSDTLTTTNPKALPWAIELRPFGAQRTLRS